LCELGVDGHMISPAYSYASVQTREIFMDREMIREKFKLACDLLEKYNLMTSPIYLEYLRGERELMCTAWGNPTYNPMGWKGPCYLMTDTHHASFNDFIENTPWDKYGRGRDPRCADCMVHVGYEPSAVLGSHRKFGDNWKMLQWQVSGKMNGGKGRTRGNGHGNGHGKGTSSLPAAPPPPKQAYQDGNFNIL
ncbi:MAG TPA: DUF3463 domain-containing protein, partial [Candidatus Solibacter sp.]|nr:DUF3463 domain-containing protein [Candidatus Solibacter sp.]